MTLKQKKCVVLAILLPFCTTVVTAAFLLAFMKTMFGYTTEDVRGPVAAASLILGVGAGLIGLGILSDSFDQQDSDE